MLRPSSLNRLIGRHQYVSQSNLGILQRKRYCTFTDKVEANKKKRLIDEQFKEYFFRPVKVLIVGTDVSALTCALTLIKNGVKPHIIDTEHYGQRLAPNNQRGSIISINARKILNLLGLGSDIQMKGAPISFYSRTDEVGKPYGSVNYRQMEYIYKTPTYGMGHIELERTLFEEVGRHVLIKSGASVQSIQNIIHEGEPQVVVDYQHRQGQTTTLESDLFDVVVISDGTFSPTRRLVLDEDHGIRGLCNMWETVIEKPKDVPSHYYLDMWGNHKRFGYFPISQGYLYVYGQHRKQITAKEAPALRIVSPHDFVSKFKDFGGHAPSILKAIEKSNHCTETVSIFSQTKKFHTGRVLFLGNASHTLPIPSHGFDIGLAVTSAYFLATSLIFKIQPIDDVLTKFENMKETYTYLTGHLSGDIAAAVLDNSSLWPWAKKLSYKFLYSDKKLTNIETQFLTSAHNDITNQLQNEQLIESLRREFFGLTDEQREEIIQKLKNQQELGRTGIATKPDEKSKANDRISP